MQYSSMVVGFLPILSQALITRSSLNFPSVRNSSKLNFSETDSRGCEDGTWSCPKTWMTGELGDKSKVPKDARAFVAAHNIYRCMHDVQAVLWDQEVFAGAKTWADKIGDAMQHAEYGTEYIKKAQGENLAGTFEFASKPGVDATHMWYQEIVNPCKWSQPCFQSFDAGHFTAMIWKSVNKIAYSDPTGKIAVGRYQGCNGEPPNFNNAYTTMVPPPVKNWETCATEVLGCAAFDGLTEENVEGCDAGGACCKGSEHGGWFVTYGTTCKAKYADITSKITTLLNTSSAVAGGKRPKTHLHQA